MAAADVRWMLRLLAMRVERGAAGRYRQLELDAKVLTKARHVFEKELAGGKAVERRRLMEALRENGIATDEYRWYSALEEENHYIAQANAPVDPKSKKLTDSLVSARYNGEFVMVSPDTITLMDVSPNQLVSVAASLIPFLEHDDANRALMG